MMWRFIALEYAAGWISLRSFEDWLYTHTWEDEQSGIYDMKLRLAEYSHGDWTEAELRQWVRSIASHYVIGEMPIGVVCAGSNVTTTHGLYLKAA